MTGSLCPFCTVPRERVLYEERLVQVVADAFPVTHGHVLLVPKRHVATWFDASLEEQDELMHTVRKVRRMLDERYRPDGYNIGLNVGDAAGQTIFHLHLHVIPRYVGDTADPTGGVRNVIPEKGNYRRGIQSPASLLGGLPHHRALVRGWEVPLLPHLLVEIDQAVRADLAVAFVQPSGLKYVLEHLRDLLHRGGHLRLLTGDYLDITDPTSLFLLTDLHAQHPEQVQLRVYESAGSSFHPKAYLFYRSNGMATAYVGSSNLTHTALATGVEWNYRVVSAHTSPGLADVAEAFEQLFLHASTRPLDDDSIRAYENRRRARRRQW